MYRNSGSHFFSTRQPPISLFKLATTTTTFLAVRCLFRSWVWKGWCGALYESHSWYPNHFNVTTFHNVEKNENSLNEHAPILMLILIIHWSMFNCLHTFIPIWCNLNLVSSPPQGTAKMLRVIRKHNWLQSCIYSWFLFYGKMG